MDKVSATDIADAIRFLEREFPDAYKEFNRAVTEGKRNPPNNDISEEERKRVINSHPELLVINPAIWMKYRDMGVPYIIGITNELANLAPSKNEGG